MNLTVNLKKITGSPFNVRPEDGRNKDISYLEALQDKRSNTNEKSPEILIYKESQGFSCY